MFKRMHDERGLTLVELLVVIAILAIIVALVVPNLTGLVPTARSAAIKQERDTVQAAIDAYYTQDYEVNGSSAITAQASFMSVGPNVPSTFGVYLKRASKYYYTWSDDGEDLVVSPAAQ